MLEDLQERLFDLIENTDWMDSEARNRACGALSVVSSPSVAKRLVRSAKLPRFARFKAAEAVDDVESLMLLIELLRDEPETAAWYILAVPVLFRAVELDCVHMLPREEILKLAKAAQRRSMSPEQRRIVGGLLASAGCGYVC